VNGARSSSHRPVTAGHGLAPGTYASLPGLLPLYLRDLQMHTPADARQGYGDVAGRKPNIKFATQLVKAHADAGGPRGLDP